MTIRTIKTTEEEAELIRQNKHHFIIRSDKDHFSENDIIKFQVMKNQKPVRRDIDNEYFVVTMVFDSSLAPITNGHQLIEFRRLS